LVDSARALFGVFTGLALGNAFAWARSQGQLGRCPLPTSAAKGMLEITIVEALCLFRELAVSEPPWGCKRT